MPGRVGVQHPDQLVAGRLGRHDAAGRPAQRGPDRGPEERPLDRGVHVGLGEEGRVVDGHHDRLPGPQRHRVVRRVQHVRVDLLRRPAAGRSAPRPAGPVGARSAAGPGRSSPPAPSGANRSASARWHATAKSASAAPSAEISPSTYRPTPPRSAGTAVASTSTRGARPDTNRLLRSARRWCVLPAGTPKARRRDSVRPPTPLSVTTGLMSPGRSRAATARERPRTRSSGRPGPGRPRPARPRTRRVDRLGQRPGQRGGSSRGTTTAAPPPTSTSAGASETTTGTPAAIASSTGSPKPSARLGDDQRGRAVQHDGEVRVGEPAEDPHPAGGSPSRGPSAQRVDAAPAGLADEQQRQVRRRRVGQRGQQHVQALARLQRGQAEQVPRRAGRAGGARRRRPRASVSDGRGHALADHAHPVAEPGSVAASSPRRRCGRAPRTASAVAAAR